MNDRVYEDFCQRRKASGEFRSLSETRPLPHGYASRKGLHVVNLSSNDYLGLSQHPLLIERAREFAAMYGAGSTASRLLGGNLPPYALLEAKLAECKGRPTSLIMASGFQTNLSVMAALADGKALRTNTCILVDRLSHHSILQGALMSKAKLFRFQHNDMDHLQRLLRVQASKDTHLIIATERVFSMDGDEPDMQKLKQLADEFGALLYIDEAHSLPVNQIQGETRSDHMEDRSILMGTFGKAFGSFGAYIATSRVIRDYLLQRCGGLIYTTALPPAVLGAIDAALELLPSLHAERTYLKRISLKLLKALQIQGWKCGASTTHIIPVILGSPEDAVQLSEKLLGEGFYVPAIRPPTVPFGQSRLRFSLSAAHKEADIDALILAMSNLAARHAVTTAAA